MKQEWIMDELICQLELKLKGLIKKYKCLKDINVNLQLDQTSLTQEKEHLLIKNKLAILQIEKMVSRLKSIEKSS